MSEGPLPPLVFGRAVTDTDLDEVAALEARSFHNPWTRDMIARDLAQSSVGHVFVLRRPGGPVLAFCSCWIVVEELHVITLAVDAEYRLGLRLMQGVLREAARLGATRATLEVRASNVAARRLYESLGFAVATVRPAYYTNPDEDAFILWRHGLTSPDDREPEASSRTAARQS
jgi:[ribosomal protein S18]-alanine N-acetyltransferase